ncbi:uncharacterized protein A1O5_10240 [Cladophialophora psammophila CBS 110553]|uniref:Dienelactone hydrolase domain-containing protein n=1 Tax=Cladophialophora psammophila CBS 110553 TaxID=1182543 RepID=W9WNJ4_9EURO|nr:uncharacterized protein A1O5_10240 [Cladophialophora psammophila CBS 110553]EXJ66570.1 hypothetical protein A1O5_10240 [Cladophialophora psammophila CBS 110553]
MAQAGALAGYLNSEKSKGLDGTYERLGDLKIPVPVAQGSDDKMIPTINSFHLQQKVPNGQLFIYPNSGHGFLYHYADLFAKQVNTFQLCPFPKVAQSH